MPTFHKGDMWSVFHTVDHFIICTNSTLRGDGTLVMTDGLAAQACAKFEGLDKAIGRYVSEHGPDYGLNAKNKIGVMQTRYRHKDDSNLGLVSAGVKALKELAQANPEKVYALQRPASEMPAFTCKDIIASLPDNVQVWDHE